MNIRILYEDKAILVCEKPSGVAVQTRNIMQKDMVSLLSQYRIDNGENPGVYVVHRLDQSTRGLMVFAKTSQAAAALSKQVADGFFDKRYYAYVEGVSLPDEGDLENYLLHDKKANVSKIVDKKTQGAKRAFLTYKVLDRKENCSLLDIKLFTGRTHQIRCQMAGIGAPLCSDVKYGAKKTENSFFLCAYMLSFRHPLTGEELSYELSIGD